MYADCIGVEMDASETEFLFTGDSPNDGPMFGYFSNSVGVANVRDFEDQLDTPPKFVTENRGGEGFSEVVERILSAMASAPNAS